MSFADYPSSPGSVTTIGGVSAAENCPAGNLNNIARQLAADGRELWDIVAAINLADYVPKTGGVFTGNPTFTGQGGYLHHAAAAQSGGRITTVPTGTARPASPAEGDIQFYYS